MKYSLVVCLVGLFVAIGVTPSVVAQSPAAVPDRATQALQKGISVQLAITHNAVAMPDADAEDAFIVSVTASGSVYLGINPISPAALAGKLKSDPLNRTEKKLYIKADARSPYASLVKVLDNVHAAGVEATVLLTSQRESSEAGSPVPPKGIEVLIGSLPQSGSTPAVVEVLQSEQQEPALKVDNERIPAGALQSTLRRLIENRKEKLVLVKADGQLRYSRVVHVIDTCRATGATVVLATPPITN